MLAGYAPLDRWARDGVWEMPLWIQLAEYLLLGVALLLDPRRPRLGMAGNRPDSLVISER